MSRAIYYGPVVCTKLSSCFLIAADASSFGADYDRLHPCWVAVFALSSRHCPHLEVCFARLLQSTALLVVLYTRRVTVRMLQQQARLHCRCNDDHRPPDDPYALQADDWTALLMPALGQTGFAQVPTPTLFW